MQVNLPYSIKLGEVATVSGSVFNYQESRLDGVDVALEGNPKFRWYEKGLTIHEVSRVILWWLAAGTGVTFSMADGHPFSSNTDLKVDVESNAATFFTFQAGSIT